MDRPKKDDRELIQFKELYKSIAPMLIFYAGKYVNAVTAEDLVQDVFLKVWQKRTFLFLKEGIKTYLYRSVQHACLDYLKHHCKVTYTNLLTSGRLNAYLADIDRQAQERFERLIEGMKQAQGITEQLKAENALEWTGCLNNIRACAREIVEKEIIFA